MPMPPYPIYCYTPGCKNLASYKIAGRLERWRAKRTQNILALLCRLLTRGPSPQQGKAEGMPAHPE